MLPNAFPAQLFVTNLCTMDKIAHLFYCSDCFLDFLLYPQIRHTQLTFEVLKKSESQQFSSLYFIPLHCFSHKY